MEQGEEHRNLLKLKRLVDGKKLDDLLGYLGGELGWNIRLSEEQSRCQRGSGSGEEYRPSTVGLKG